MREPVAIASAPPIASDIGPALEVLALAMDRPGDVLHVYPTEGPTLSLEVLGDNDQVELDPKQNTAALAFQTLIEPHDVRPGWRLVLHKRVPTGVGLGSSAASAAVGAVAGYRTLLSLGRDCETTSILAAAAKAEETVTGFPHAHAVGAALWGGCCVAYSQHPAAIAYLTPQIDLRVCVVVPRVKLSRKTYRSALPGQVHLMKHARHAGLTAGLVFGLATGDVLLVRRSARDHIVAPAVGPFIPGYFPAAKAAEEAGALAFSISGSGPAVVALCGSIDDAMAVEQAVTEAFNAHSIATTSFFAGVGRKRRFEVTRGYSTP